MDVVSTGIRGFTYGGVFPPCLPVSVFGGGVVAHECESTHVLMIIEVVSGICVRTFKMLTFRMGPKSGLPCPRISQMSTLRHSDHHVLMPSRPHVTVVLVTPWSGAGASRSRCACWCNATSGARVVDPPAVARPRSTPSPRASDRFGQCGRSDAGEDDRRGAYALLVPYCAVVAGPGRHPRGAASSPSRGGSPSSRTVRAGGVANRHAERASRRYALRSRSCE